MEHFVFFKRSSLSYSFLQFWVNNIKQVSLISWYAWVSIVIKIILYIKACSCITLWLIIQVCFSHLLYVLLFSLHLSLMLYVIFQVSFLLFVKNSLYFLSEHTMLISSSTSLDKSPENTLISILLKDYWSRQKFVVLFFLLSRWGFKAINIGTKSVSEMNLSLSYSVKFAKIKVLRFHAPSRY